MGFCIYFAPEQYQIGHTKNCHDSGSGSESLLCPFFHLVPMHMIASQCIISFFFSKQELRLCLVVSPLTRTHCSFVNSVC